MITKGKSLLTLTFIYMYLPVLIFLCGWTRPVWSIVTVIVLGIGIVLMIQDYSAQEGGYPDIRISIPMLLLAALIITAICIFVGIGGIYPQAGDWYKHNAVLRDLTIADWPVYYTVYDKSMLTYYLGQYLVPALIGKITGNFDVSNIAMMVWAIAGLILVYIHLVRVVKADNIWKQLITLFIMFFFCGALVVCQSIMTSIYGEEMGSGGSYHWVLVHDAMLQYRSNLIMIRWVFPQVIVPWMATLLFMEHFKQVKYYVLLILPSIIFGTFSFGALVLVAFITAIALLLKHDITFKDIFSPLNILPALTFGLISFFYLLGNLMVDKPYSSSFRLQTYPGMYIFIYIFFCLCMFGVYAICVAPENKKNILFYANVVVLLILPWFRMGLCNDIVMSGSIPSLFVLMILVIQLLFNNAESTSLGIRKGLCIAVLLIGCIYPMSELSDNIRANEKGINLADGYTTMKWFTDRTAEDVSEDLVFNYYTYDLDGQIFYEYIARKKIQD